MRATPTPLIPKKTRELLASIQSAINDPRLAHETARQAVDGVLEIAKDICLAIEANASEYGYCDQTLARQIRLKARECIDQIDALARERDRGDDTAP